jgi:hypothetical protein
MDLHLLLYLYVMTDCSGLKTQIAIKNKIEKSTVHQSDIIASLPHGPVSHFIYYIYILNLL